MSQSPTTLDWDVVAEELSGQPELFSMDLPVALPLLRGAKRLAYSGKITCRDTARAAQLALVYHQTGSKRETAKLCGCDTRTVDNVLREMEAGGKLPALKERLPALLAAAAADAVEWVRELIDERGISAERAAMIKALGVVAGIGADKVAAAPPTEHRHVHVVLDDVRDSARRYLDLIAVPPDSGSGSTTLPPSVLRPNATRDATPEPVDGAAAPPCPDVRTEGGAGGCAPGEGTLEGGGL